MNILTRISALALVAVAVTINAQAGVVIVPASGFNFTWDGNDGDFYDNVSAPAIVPTNAALGGTPIASNPTSPHFPPHNFANLNDGFYGNSYSHINGGGHPAWMGIILPNATQINTIAFGRDNGTPGGATPPGGAFDCCGGILRDRSVGLYTLQFTDDGGASWTSIGTLQYDAVGADDAPGGTFDPHLRHQYDVSAVGGPIFGDGVRILLPNNGIAVDEIEINTIPEPAGVLLVALSLVGLAMRRRRQR